MSELRNALVWMVVVVGVTACGVEGDPVESSPEELARGLRLCDEEAVACDPECDLLVDFDGDADACLCPDDVGGPGGVFGRLFLIEDPVCDDSHPVWVVGPGDDACARAGCVTSDA